MYVDLQFIYFHDMFLFSSYYDGNDIIITIVLSPSIINYKKEKLTITN